MLISHWKIPENLINESNINIENFENIIKNLLFENYLKKKKPINIKLPFVYNKLPVSLRNFLFKILIKFKKDPKFPNWPIETKIEDLRSEFVKNLRVKLKKRIPYISFWPKGEFALVLTHDMDTKSSFEHIEEIREVEKSFNLKSSWNVLANKYKIDFEKLRKLKKEGCEIGCHGYNHDGKLSFLPKSKMESRINFCLEILKKFDVKGFRSPQLQKNKELLDVLNDKFVYDSSMADTDVYSIVGMRSGCCTVFPYFIKNLVELPLTMPQDYRMMFTLNLSDEKTLEIWKKKIDYIRKVNGMVLFNLHPDDYLSGSRRGLKLYKEILEYLSNYDYYHALPIEVAEWWKERNKSEIKAGKVIGSKRAKINLFD